MRAPGLDAAAQAELEAEQSAATAEVQRATQAEGLSRRMGQAAQEELGRLEAEVAEERISFQEFEPWFAEHEPQLHPEGLLFEKFTPEMRKSRAVVAEIHSSRVPAMLSRTGSAIDHFKRCDEDLVGELRPAEFRAMCEDMGWGADDIEQ